jgi:hypothetical protein
MGDKQHNLAIVLPEVIAVLPSELNAVPTVDSINGNQPEGIAIQIDHPIADQPRILHFPFGLVAAITS